MSKDSDFFLLRKDLCLILRKPQALFLQELIYLTDAPGAKKLKVREKSNEVNEYTLVSQKTMRGSLDWSPYEQTANLGLLQSEKLVRTIKKRPDAGTTSPIRYVWLDLLELERRIEHAKQGKFKKGIKKGEYVTEDET